MRKVRVNKNQGVSSSVPRQSIILKQMVHLCVPESQKPRQDRSLWSALSPCQLETEPAQFLTRSCYSILRGRLVFNLSFLQEVTLASRPSGEGEFRMCSFRLEEDVMTWPWNTPVKSLSPFSCEWYWVCPCLKFSDILQKVRQWQWLLFLWRDVARKRRLT